jgi:RimJ/RimL family protein N-acetyltransferase
MEIRRLSQTDVGNFKQIRIAAVEDCPTSFYPTRQELVDTADEEFLMHLTQSDCRAVFGAIERDELIGIVGIIRDQRVKLRHKAELVGMYVRPPFRGRGVARQLMLEAIGFAQSNPEIMHLKLGVNSINQAAKSLYLACGFESFGLERNSMCVDGIYSHEEHMMLALR